MRYAGAVQTTVRHPAGRKHGQSRKNRLVISSVDFGGETINLVSAHLTKPYFDDFQMAELEDLTKALGSIDGPLVLSGDFNSSAIAPSIQGLLREQKLKTIAPEPATGRSLPARSGSPSTIYLRARRFI